MLLVMLLKMMTNTNTNKNTNTNSEHIKIMNTLGMLLVMLLKILTRTRNTVTRIVILPGTLSGGTRKLKKKALKDVFGWDQKTGCVGVEQITESNPSQFTD